LDAAVARIESCEQGDNGPAFCLLAGKDIKVKSETKSNHNNKMTTTHNNATTIPGLETSMVEISTAEAEADNAAPLVLILDVDGVMTTGQFLYSAEGKAMKVFSADDNDGLSLLKPFIEIRFVTGDKKGWPISAKRIVDDMGYPLDLVSTVRRIDWISERYDPQRVIYMGDGIFDHYVMRQVAYAIAPANADRNAKQSAHFVTERPGGDRAVAEACLHIMARFFVAFDPNALPQTKGALSGAWAV
jgi:3-deoxy-D-manno-octulosonate 8-phosphate phosphatase (KDO 8-P phosphatase)